MIYELQIKSDTNAESEKHLDMNISYQKDQLVSLEYEIK